MGNQAGKQDGDGVDQGLPAPARAPGSKELELAFETLTKSEHEPNEGKQLSSIHFQMMFDKLPYLAESIYQRCLHCETGAVGLSDNTEISICKQKYVALGLNLLHMTHHQDKMDFCISLFTPGNSTLSIKDFQSLVNTSFAIELLSGNFAHEQIEESLLNAMTKSLFSSQLEVEKSDFFSWSNRHCPRILHSVHSYVCSTLCEPQQIHSAAAGPSTEILKGHLLSVSTLWSLYCYVPNVYTLNAESASHSDVLHNKQSMSTLFGPEAWQLLYDSNQNGLSINRFIHHVLCYKGPSLTFIQFEGHLYCLGTDVEWRDQSTRWGNSDCFLLQIYPQFRLMQVGAGMLYFNTLDRKYPKGLHIGKDSRTTLLQIDEDFSAIKHYGVECPIQTIEVWGCSDQSTLEAQKNQRSWETREAQKNKDRKLKLEDWKDNPDRQLLEYGGVTTEHAER